MSMQCAIEIHRYSDPDHYVIAEISKVSRAEQQGLSEADLQWLSAAERERMESDYWTRFQITNAGDQEALLRKMRNLGYVVKLHIGEVNNETYRFIKMQIIPLEWQHDFDTNEEIRSRVWVWTKDETTAKQLVV